MVVEFMESVWPLVIVATGVGCFAGVRVERNRWRRRDRALTRRVRRVVMGVDEAVARDRKRNSGKFPDTPRSQQLYRV